MLVSDPDITVLVDGSGNCIEIEDGLVAIGSGGLYAQSAASAMLDNEMLCAEEIAKRAMNIAGNLCVYTNHTTVLEILHSQKKGNDNLVLGVVDDSVKNLLAYLKVPHQTTEGLVGLKDGDFEIQDNIAMIKYLCRKHSSGLLGRSATELAIAESL